MHHEGPGRGEPVFGQNSPLPREVIDLEFESDGETDSESDDDGEANGEKGYKGAFVIFLVGPLCAR